MKVLKVILAAALASQLLLACSKDTNSNSSNTSNTTKTSSTTTNTTKTTNAEATANSSSTALNENIFRHEAGGIQFEKPAGWKSEQSGDRMTLTSPEDALSVVIYVASEENFKEATEAIDKELSKTIKNVKTNGEPQETKLDGMETVTTNGTGEVDGNEIRWAVDLIKAKKPVIVLTFAAPGLWEKYQGDYQKLGKSIKHLS